MYAMASGELAAQAILETDMNDTNIGKIYNRLLGKNLLKELKSALKIAQLVYPRIENGFKALKRFNELGYLYLDVMAGALSYQDFNKALLGKMKDAGKRKLSRWLKKDKHQKKFNSS
jgi:flavin-dependent dehydrogenase